MKKSSIADQIEHKIRHMNDRYNHLKNCSSENILHQQALPKNPINDIIRQDLKTHLPILKLQVSRDVSHLQKNRSPKLTALPSMFPTDISKIKSLLESQLYPESMQAYGIKDMVGNTHSRKFSGIEEQTIEFLEKIDHAYPSSRKEAENLMNWFLEMKGKHESEDDFESVIALCEQELVKNALVQCKTRGNLLKMVFSHYHSISLRNKEKADEKLQSVIKRYEEKFKKQAKKLEDVNQKLVNKGVELANLVKMNDEMVNNLEDDISFFKKKLQDMQKLYLQEQELWKKQWMNVSRRNTNKPLVMLHSSYNLAVTRLRDDMYKTPTPIEPTFPEDIKKKIENGEALDLNELQQYREMYFQYQQEVQDLNFCDAEVQTEEIVNDLDHYSPRSSNSSYRSEEFLRASINLKLNQEKNSEKSMENEKSVKVNKEFNEKEVQTDEYDQFNDSELDEIQNILENEMLEEFEENSQSDEDDSIVSSSKSPWLQLSNYKTRESPEKFGEYLAKKDPAFQFKSPILQTDTLDVVEESALEQEIQNSPKSERELGLLIIPSGVSNIKIQSTDFAQSKGRIKTIREKNNSKIGSNQKRNSQLITLKGSNLASSPRPPSQVNTPKTQKNVSFTEAAEPKLLPSPVNQINLAKNLAEKKFEEENGSNKRDILETVENIGFSSLGKIGNKAQKQGLEGISEDDSDEESVDETQSFSDISKAPFSQSRSPDLIQSSQRLNNASPDIDIKNMENIKNSKRNSYLISIKQPSERRGSMPLNFSRNPTLYKDPVNPSTKPENRLSILLNNLNDPSAPKNLKQTTLALVSTIQKKKKELAELEKKIEEKKRLLNDSDSFDSNENSVDQSLQTNKKRMSTSDLLKGVLKRMSLIVSSNPEDERRKSFSSHLIKNLLVEELKKRNSVVVETRRRSFVNAPINEEDEQDQEVEEFDLKAWENAYNAGFSRGKRSGQNNIKTSRGAENEADGNVRVFKDLKNDSALDDSKLNASESSFNLSQFRMRRGSVQNEFRAIKELTKFAEFKFSKQKPAVPKPLSPVPELIKGMMKRNKEYLDKKAKAGRKMVNKIISNTYSLAVGKNGLESPEELLEICYDEFSQRYGLKKVTDRKFLEFLASILKLSNLKKPQMFIKLTGFGNYINQPTYSKYTVTLYLNSLNYMLTSKVGITMNYEETDDKNFFPINRAIECIKEKLEGLVDRLSIFSIIGIIETKSIPDPQRISTGLIDLEYVLEFLCDTYETQQKKILKGAKLVFKALGYEEKDQILQYDLALAVRFICPQKFLRMESEENLVQKLSFEETLDICIEMNVLSEHDIGNFIKNYAKVPFQNLSELLDIVDRMGKFKCEWISVDEHRWREKLEMCQRTLDPNSQLAVIAWKVYESELKRIETDYLN